MSPPEHARSLLAASEDARRRGASREGATLALDAAAAAERAGDAETAAEAHSLLSLHWLRLGDVEAAIASGQQALQHGALHGPPAVRAQAHGRLSAAYERAGLNTLAVAHAAQSLQAARDAGDALAECRALNRLGTAVADGGDAHRGLQMLAEALVLARSLAHPDETFAALNNGARRWLVESDRLAATGADAGPALRQALALAEEAAACAGPPLTPFAAATAGANLASIHARLGHAAQAQAEFSAALALAQQHGWGGLAATLRLALASLAFEAAPSADTAAALLQRLEGTDPPPDPDLRLQARRALVKGLRAMGDPAAALAQMEHLHAEVLAAQQQRADLQSRVLFSQAERDQLRHAAESARMDAEIERLRADAEHRAARLLELDRDHLEREVAARTAELQRAKTAAEAASRAKSTFLSVISHEMRTPIAGLIGMVQVARRRAVDPRQIDQLDKAAASGRALSALFDGILNYVAAEASAPAQLRDTDLRALLADVLQPLEPAAQAKGLPLALDVAADVPAQLRLDADRLRQVLAALADNAVKFGTRGPVRLAARWAPAAGQPALLRLEVSDAGPGIEPAELQRLFKPFEMGDDSRTRRHGGLGLGLALAQRLVQGMGGDIGADSRPGVGSTFWVAVPLARG